MKNSTTSSQSIWICCEQREDADRIFSRFDTATHLRCSQLDHTTELAALAATATPSLVIVDGRSSIAFARNCVRRVRSFEPTLATPILVLGDNDAICSDCELMQTQHFDFVSSPLDSLEFLLRVRNMINLGDVLNRLASTQGAVAAAVEASTAALRTREEETLLMLSRAAEFRDPDTGTHIQRMAAYCELLARKLQHLHPYDPRDVRLAAPMHDIGKIAMPDAVLRCESGFSDEEWRVMQQHAQIGHDALCHSQSPVLQMGAVIALSHHEAWDGNGYPQRLKGEDIPILGRIVAVADVFDALTSERPYKAAWSTDEAFEELQRLAGKKLDPQVVNAFTASRHEVEAIIEACGYVPSRRAVFYID